MNKIVELKKSSYLEIERLANNIGEIVYHISLDEKSNVKIEFISDNVKSILGYSTDDFF